MIKEQKSFKGQAFIAKPDKIEFKDFTVGKPHYLVITLTNVSNAFNSFNVLPLPPKIRVNITRNLELLWSRIHSKRQNIAGYKYWHKVQVSPSIKLRYSLRIYNTSRDWHDFFWNFMLIEKNNCKLCRPNGSTCQLWESYLRWVRKGAAQISKFWIIAFRLVKFFITLGKFNVSRSAI